MTPAGRSCHDRGVMSTRPLVFARRADHRVLAGVAGGFADQHGLDPVLVRGALVVLTLAGGVGVVVYALGFAWSADPGTLLPARRRPDRRRSMAFICIAAGAALVMRAAGLWLGDPLMVAVVAVVAGVGVLRARDADIGDDAQSRRAALRLPGMTDGRYARLRIFGGALVIAIGLLVVGGQDNVSGRLRFGVFATACTIVGVALLFGPWIARSAQDVAEERRRRIRSEERAEMAAHLHDSVLQTLALIQRNAGDPRRTVTIARRQERELRSWLYGSEASEESLAAAVRSMTEDVEAHYDVKVDAIVVGDRPMDETSGTVVGATREACVNAAKHSGTHEVSVFVEVRSDAIEAFVRDRGQGFDRDAVADDRKGISESIEGRVERAGGSAEVDSTIGTGTEVHLRVPLHHHEVR